MPILNGEQRPVVIPQDAPGLREMFSRAWAPELASHNVTPDEFLAFIDHLNVCKAASPPFQVLNLAGTVLGFTSVTPSYSINQTIFLVAKFSTQFALAGS